MKKELRFGIAFFIFVCSITCTQNILAQVKLPGIWQPGMKLTVYTGPGMQPDSWTTVISTQGCYTIYHDGAKDKKTRFALSKADLDSLIKVFIKRNLQLIESQPRGGMVYDMRSTSMMLEWDGHIIGTGITASTQVQEKYEEDLREILAYIRMLVSKKHKGEPGV